MESISCIAAHNLDSSSNHNYPLHTQHSTYNYVSHQTPHDHYSEYNLIYAAHNNPHTSDGTHQYTLSNLNQPSRDRKRIFQMHRVMRFLGIDCSLCPVARSILSEDHI